MTISETAQADQPEPDRSMEDPTRVFVVDDHAGYRAVAAAVIDATPGFVFCGSSAGADEAVEAIRSIDPVPDLVLMDINLGESSGVDVTAAITRSRPEVAIIFVSALGADELPPGVRECGAVGYLPKVMLSPTALEAARAGAYDWRP